ncbi:hypothetical protein [Polymorphospora sp. NPDC050346]|uniref:hypothetical protein n=1 Tax=Polymorphospora sp. NPDC050346 TaxID=3155780 RepID=UPI0033C9838E
MAISGSRVRRAATALLAGVAVAGLLGATAAAAPPDATPDRLMTVTDVWMRDVSGDVGLQPHSGSPIWASPDLKICPTAVGCFSSVSPVVGGTNHIVTTLRNPGPYGEGTDTGTLAFYRSSPSGSLVWPTAWTFVTSVIVTVPTGGTTVSVPWISVPGPGHFSLIAVWRSLNDPLSPLTPDILTNVRNNNNIVWRDLDSVALLAGGGLGAKHPPATVHTTSVG